METRRNVLRALGAAATAPAVVAYSGNGAGDDETYCDDRATEAEDFELSGTRDIIVDFNPVDDRIMYSDVDTTLLRYEEEELYDVVVTYDTDLEFYWRPTNEEFAAYDLSRLESGRDEPLEFARFDHGEDAYSFERVFFDEWFDTVAQVERIINGHTRIGVQELGLDGERIAPGMRTMTPGSYRLQVHGTGGGKYHITVPGVDAVIADEPTRRDRQAWEEILRDPDLIMGGTRT